MKKIAIQFIIFALLSFCFIDCDTGPKGNIPGISQVIPIYPGAKITEGFEKSSQKSVPSNIESRVVIATINTDAGPGAILEFYKNNLHNITIEDYGGYFSIRRLPAGQKSKSKIEIMIPKASLGKGAGYYEIIESK